MQPQFPQEEAKPWYGEFWAWFVFAPLIIVVIACSVMVTIAFKGRQDVVADDYYKMGKMINREFVPEHRARELGVSADLIFDTDSGEVIVTTTANNKVNDEALILAFSHPIKAKRDHFITLKPVVAGRWRADINFAMAGRWYLRLSSIDDAGKELWRLKGAVELQAKTQIKLNARMHAPHN